MNAKDGKDSTFTLSVPYCYADPVTDFNYGRELQSQEYADKLVSTINKYKEGIVLMYQTRLGENMAANNYRKEKVQYKQQGYHYKDTKVNLYNAEKKELTVDEMIEYYQMEEPFVVIINMYQLGKEGNEELLEDIKMWASESRKINESDELTDLEKIQGLSKKNLSITIDDANSKAVLENCKMIDYLNNRTFVFLVERIVFVV